jgi:hypothetical protein
MKGFQASLTSINTNLTLMTELMHKISNNLISANVPTLVSIASNTETSPPSNEPINKEVAELQEQVLKNPAS